MTNRHSFCVTAAFSLVLITVLGVFSHLSYAEMLYYLPFDDGVNSTLDNYGTVGGEAVSVPYDDWFHSTFSQETPVHGEPYSRYFRIFPWNNQIGPHIQLPNSSSKLLLDQQGDAMTVSTWIRRYGKVRLAHRPRIIIHPPSTAISTMSPSGTKNYRPNRSPQSTTWPRTSA